MIVTDTSIWVDHLRTGNSELARLLDAGEVLCHPWVIGELALGGLPAGERALMERLPTSVVATDDEVVALIDSERLAGAGIGWVDSALLAATRLTPPGRLWTRDRRLARVADQLGVGYP